MKPLLENSIDSLGDYAFMLANKMGLGDHRLHFQVGTMENPEHGIEVSTHPGAKSAYITLRDDWAYSQPWQLRENIVHELVHLYTRPIKDVVYEQADLLGRIMVTMMGNQMTVHEEYAVDMISRLWARTMPLPTRKLWPKP